MYSAAFFEALKKRFLRHRIVLEPRAEKNRRGEIPASLRRASAPERDEAPAKKQKQKENPGEEQILIYFTDGYGDIPPKPTYPVLWVITPDGKNQVPWGSVIKLDKDS